MKSSHINHALALVGLCAAAAMWHYGLAAYSGGTTLLAVVAMAFSIVDRLEDN